MDDLLTEFLSEMEEAFSNIDSQLRILEQDSQNEEVIASIFRTIHTLKGTAAFLDLECLEKLAHTLENVMSKFRDKKVSSKEAVALVIRSVDRIRDMLDYIAVNEVEDKSGNKQLIDALNWVSSIEEDSNFEETSTSFAGEEVQYAEEGNFEETSTSFVGEEVQYAEEGNFEETSTSFAGEEVQYAEEGNFEEASTSFVGEEVQSVEEGNFEETSTSFVGEEVQSVEEGNFEETSTSFAGEEVQYAEEGNFEEASTSFVGEEVQSVEEGNFEETSTSFVGEEVQSVEEGNFEETSTSFVGEEVQSVEEGNFEGASTSFVGEEVQSAEEGNFEEVSTSFAGEEVQYVEDSNFEETSTSFAGEEVQYAEEGNFEEASTSFVGEEVQSAEEGNFEEASTSFAGEEVQSAEDGNFEGASTSFAGEEVQYAEEGNFEEASTSFVGEEVQSVEEGNFEGASTSFVGEEVQYAEDSNFEEVSTSFAGEEVQYAEDGNFEGASTSFVGEEVQYAEDGNFEETSTSFAGEEVQSVEEGNFEGASTSFVGEEVQSAEEGNFEEVSTSFAGEEVQYVEDSNFEETSTSFAGEEVQYAEEGNFEEASTSFVGEEVQSAEEGNFEEASTSFAGEEVQSAEDGNFEEASTSFDDGKAGHKGKNIYNVSSFLNVDSLPNDINASFARVLSSVANDLLEDKRKDVPSTENKDLKSSKDEVLSRKNDNRNKKKNNDRGIKKKHSLNQNVIKNVRGIIDKVLLDDGSKKLKNNNVNLQSVSNLDDSKVSKRSNSTLRIKVNILENLMTLVSELVLSRNSLSQLIRGRGDHELNNSLQRLSQITTELQDNIMMTRMQPIGNAWNNLPRLVRKLCDDSGKSVELQLEGADTELERQVLDLIREVLIHVVRNAVDHGIESKEVRRGKGKNETGLIKLKAYHQGGYIVICVSNDGEAINIDKIKEKVLKEGHATAEELSLLSDEQIQQYIFVPGFTTVDKVTNISGRGVGMDIVHSGVEKLGGVIELSSNEGDVSFTIKIPLTLAIVSVLIIGSGSQRFAIPQLSISEVVFVSNGSDYRIEMLNDAPVLRLRNRLIPLISLEKVLNLSENDNDSIFSMRKDIFIVVMQAGNNIFGLIVDKIYDTEEIVIKPVSKLLQNLTVFLGNTILGDGSVVMILDPSGIAKVTGNVNDMLSVKFNNYGLKETASSEATPNKRESILLFSAGNDATDNLSGVPLSLVSRLDEVDLNVIEHINGKVVIRYREKLLPVHIIGSEFDDNKGSAFVLVFSSKGKSIGILASQVIDIVDDNIEIDLDSYNKGTLGTTIVGGVSCNIVDVGYYFVQSYPNWFSDEDELLFEKKEEKSSKLIMLIENEGFYRKLLITQFSAIGYDVMVINTVDEAKKAFKELDVYAIVSSLNVEEDMKELIAQVKKQSGRTIPVVGLVSTVSNRAKIVQAEKIGFDLIVLRSDFKGILKSLDKL